MQKNCLNQANYWWDNVGFLSLEHQWLNNATTTIFFFSWQVTELVLKKEDEKKKELQVGKQKVRNKKLKKDKGKSIRALYPTKKQIRKK